MTIRSALLAVGVLGAIHLALALVSEPGLGASLNLALFATNLWVIYCARPLLVAPRSLGLFVVGYLLLFLLVMVLMNRTTLFILLVIAYASVFRSRFLLGFFCLFVLSFVLLQPYAVETFIPLLLIYLVLWRVRRASLFLRLCLGGGLVALALVLFPLLHLGLQDSPQTLWLTLARPDVREAILFSLVSATLATLIITLWGVPLAYALARSEFRGKGLVESLIDVPILVPQSVVGIALMVLLGSGSALGDALYQIFGIQVAGRMVGIIIAQVFVGAPFLIKTALTAFEGVSLRLEEASRTLGASPAMTFRRIALPLAARGIAMGMILAWARAISELGAILLFASSPVTAPILVHTEFLRAGASESRPIAILLLIICLWIFVLLQFGQTLLPFAYRRAGRM